MVIRLGYVAMTRNLPECSPSKTITAKAYNSLTTDSSKIFRLRKTAKENLINTTRILRYNEANNIHVYRLTSKLIPLATYDETLEWDWECDLKDEFSEIGSCIFENDFRISAHPDHFTVINSPNDSIFENAVKDLEYHYKILKAAGLTDIKYKLILHIGGMYKTKEFAAMRFMRNFERIPDYIKEHIILENDDKSFTAEDVLEICNELKTPMVLDVHHQWCMNKETSADLLFKAFETWGGQKPKVHYSSPKGESEYRSHADYINTENFISFLKTAKEVDTDFDIMLEAKEKDNALFAIMDELKKQDFDIIDQSTFKI